MPNRFYEFVHLQLFNVRYNFVHLQLFNIRYKFVHLQLFNVKFLLSKNHIFVTQKRTAVYGRASLVSDFKLTWENDDLLSPRHKEIFEVQHPVYEYTKMRIPYKRYQTNKAHAFWGTWRASALRYLVLGHFGRYGAKICGIQMKLWHKIF